MTPPLSDSPPNPYILFNWIAVPGSDGKRLLDHLERGVRLIWARYAEIRKSDDGRTITVTDGKNSATLELDESNDSVVLTLEDGEIHTYTVKKQDKELNVFNQEMLLILREIDPDESEPLDELARCIMEKSRKNPRELVDIFHSDDLPDSKKAAYVLLNMDDIALTPLIDGIKNEIPENYVWDISTAVNVHLQARGRVVHVLETMLSDMRALKLPEHFGEEEQYAPRRVCDVAYLMLRRILSLEENREELFLSSNEFLNMSASEKDKEINRLHLSKKWISLLDQDY